MSTATYEAYYEHENLLFGIAYRMVSTIGDAEDILQDVLMDWHLKVEQSLDIESPKSYLASMVVHKAIDHVRQAYVQRETYVGTWLPEPIIASDSEEFLDRMIVKENISMAWLVLLERLSPYERAVYILRTVFDFDYETISELVGKEVAHCRKIMQRAQQHIDSDTSRYDPSTEQHLLVVREFLKAANNGDLNALLHTLLPDSTLISDGGGQTSAPLWHVRGAQRIARFMLGIRNMTSLPINYQVVIVNGDYGILASYDAQILYVMAISFHNNHIATIHNIRNPHKLRHIHLNKAGEGQMMKHVVC